jgi:diguanylate cyclase (GGDEF)-like protein
MLATLTAAGAAFAHPEELPHGRVVFRTYGAEEGLRNLVVEDVAQDAAGFLWTATQDGLYRFDGFEFIRFGVEAGLPSGAITALLPDDAGRLWVGTFAGLAWTDGVRFVATPVTAWPRTRVNGLALDARGSLWVALPQGLFHRLPDGTFHREEGWPAGEATAVGAGAGGETVFAAHGGRVGEYGLERGSWSFRETGLPAGERIDALAVDGDGRLWASSLHHLLSVGPGEARFRDDSAQVDRLSNAPTRSFLAVDRAGELWVPTDSGLYHRAGGRWRKLGAAEGLPGGWANGLYHDREGSLWAWAAGVGLHRRLGGGRWESWTREEGLPSDVVWSVRRDRAGRLWVGTSHGLARATAGGWRLAPGTEGTAIRRIAEAGDGTLWLGVQPTAVVRFDPRSGRLRTFGAEEGVRGRKILDVLVDRAEGVWVATAGGGLLNRPPGAARFSPVAVPLDGRATMVSFAMEDSAGRLWVGGVGGLAVRERGRWRRFAAADGLASDDVAQLTERAPGEFWVAYTEPVGITRFRLDAGGLRVVEHRDAGSGLTPARPYFLGAGRHGRLWLGTGGGLDVISETEVTHFDSASGLVGDDCSYMAFWPDAGGDVFIGTSRGLSRFRGSRDFAAPAPPRAAIVRAALGDRPIAVDATPRTAVGRDRNSLAVAFAGLTFLNEGRIDYQVRLVGLEPAWRRTDDRDALYPALPPGQYRFEARARIGQGAWGPAAGLDFAILPAWWQRGTVRSAAWVLGALLLFAGYQLRVRRLERRRRHLEDLVAVRTAELSALNERLHDANEELERLSATDGLTGLANRRAFDQAFDVEWRRGRRRGRALALILLDVDDFKGYNDTYGHAAGDRCLSRIGAALAGVGRRPGDLVARYGGEEFAVLLPGASLDGATAIAEIVRRRVRELVIPHAGSQVAPVVTVSLGVASTVPHPAEHRDVLFTLADQALYRAKRNGRDRVEVVTWWGDGAVGVDADGAVVEVEPARAVAER